MNINSAFPSSYLKAEDLPARTKVSVVISEVVMEDIGGDHKPVVRFKGKDKGIVLNKTNANAIVSMYGPDTDKWEGKPIKLFATTTDYQGKRVPCIRVFEEPQFDEAPADTGNGGGSGEDVPF